VLAFGAVFYGRDAPRPRHSRRSCDAGRRSRGPFAPWRRGHAVSPTRMRAGGGSTPFLTAAVHLDRFHSIAESAGRAGLRVQHRPGSHFARLTGRLFSVSGFLFFFPRLPDQRLSLWAFGEWRRWSAIGSLTGSHELSAWIPVHRAIDGNYRPLRLRDEAVVAFCPSRTTAGHTLVVPRRRSTTGGTLSGFASRT